MSGAHLQTIHELLVRQAERFGTAPAIIAPHRPPLVYAALRDEVEHTAAAFADSGIGRRTRVAQPLFNAPESVTSILAVLCAGVCVPLNPTTAPSSSPPSSAATSSASGAS